MMNYSYGKEDNKDWIVAEESFSPRALGKAESIMYLGNGYMGMRSATEERYLDEQRNLLVNGTFNKFSEEEVSELPNLADVTAIEFFVDDERFSLEFGESEEYVRYLNLKTAELIREVNWVSPAGKELTFKFKRFVSLDNLHLIGMKVEVTNNGEEVEVQFNSGINAQWTNTGSQHFHEGEKRVYDKKYLELIQTTTESNIDIVLISSHSLYLNSEAVFQEPKMEIDRRNISVDYSVNLKRNETFTLEKTTVVYTSRDKNWSAEDYSLDKMRNVALSAVKSSDEQGYDSLFDAHKEQWAEKVWNKYEFSLDSENTFDLLASRFAIYHLTTMTPAHDERMGIAAKALSGEGYKGHSFWDTEIFILPFFTFFNPDVAKSLLTYRYHGLVGARKKAIDNHYEGAMYPWEAAFPTDGEVTPVWGAVDIVTGEQTKIWSGFIEQHITADIAFAVYQYYSATNDQEFMDNYGYQMIFETAKFWSSRLEWNNDKGHYEINEVIGPDEYKEHVDNNAFTNYMAHFNMKLAMYYYDLLPKENKSLFAELNVELDLDALNEELSDRIGKVYLPKPREEDQVIPQDDTYLSLKELDISEYKKADKVGELFEDYNLEQVNQMQITKQADILVLLYLMEQAGKDITPELKKANFDYYEPKTTHDSSLSLSTHAIVAADIKENDLAYDLFSRASRIDLGPYMHTSDAGVHAASIGGIWQIIMFGFAGIRMKDGNLTINPNIPSTWNELGFVYQWKGQSVKIDITHEELTVIPQEGQTVTFETDGKEYATNQELTININ